MVPKEALFEALLVCLHTRGRVSLLSSHLILVRKLSIN